MSINIHVTLIRLEREDGFPVIYDKHFTYREGTRDSFMAQLVSESSVVNHIIMDDLEKHRWGGPYTMGHVRVAHAVTQILNVVDARKPTAHVESEVDMSNNYRLVVDVEYPAAPRRAFFRSAMEYIRNAF